MGGGRIITSPYTMLQLTCLVAFLGTSDPYVKFKIGNRQYYKSRTVLKNLNPKWDERFTIPIDDLSKVIQVKVLDYDRGLNDDPMGCAVIDPSQLEANV